MTRNRILASLLTVVVVASPVLADGLWDDFYRGLDLLSTPSGSPILPTFDGTRVNGQRSGRLRIVPNVPGSGFNLEFNRSFGVDSRGRPEILDLGALELEMAGTIQSTAGYTNREFLTGNLNSTINNLNYSFRAKTGVQDAVLSGTLNGTSDIEINQFGFYTINLALNNANSQLALDGVIARASESTNFDLGPIAVSGNIFFDGFIGLLTSIGVDTTELQQLTPYSPIDRIADAIEEQLQMDQVIAGATFERDALLLEGVSAAGGLTLPVDSSGELFSAAAKSQGNVVPEPSALALMAIGIGVLMRRRRR